MWGRHIRKEKDASEIDRKILKLFKMLFVPVKENSGSFQFLLLKDITY